MLPQQLKEAGFTLGVFNAGVLFDCGKGRIMTAVHTLFDKLSPLVGNRDQFENTKPTIDTQKEYLTASTESEIESDESIDISRKSLRPTGSKIK